IQRNRSSWPAMANNNTSNEKSRLVVASMNFSRLEALPRLLRCMTRTITAKEAIVPSTALIPSASAGDAGSLRAKPKPIPAKTATCTNWSGATRRHRNRQTNIISRKQLSSTFYYLLKIRGLDQHTSVNEEGGFIEFWYC